MSDATCCLSTQSQTSDRPAVPTRTGHPHPDQSDAFPISLIRNFLHKGKSEKPRRLLLTCYLRHREDVAANQIVSDPAFRRRLQSAAAAAAAAPMSSARAGEHLNKQAPQQASSRLHQQSSTACMHLASHLCQLEQPALQMAARVGHLQRWLLLQSLSTPLSYDLSEYLSIFCSPCQV